MRLTAVKDGRSWTLGYSYCRLNIGSRAFGVVNEIAEFLKMEFLRLGGMEL